MNHAHRTIRTVISFAALLLLAGTGCSRHYYRVSADKEVYSLVNAAGCDTPWGLKDYTIEFNPTARFFDPYRLERPPMPPDDPYSHQLMHHVYKMRGFPCWHINGDVSQVESPDWKCYLPLNPQGILVLDRQSAVQLGRINSREYQTQLETLYLSALDVTFERFRFDVQFYGGTSLFYTADGRIRGANVGARPANPASGGPAGVRGVNPARTVGNSSALLELDNSVQAQRLFASGGQLVTGLANSLVWQFAGNGTYESNTLLDFSVAQPFLRGAGRARVLERLTIAERTLLANIRQMQYYRQGFVVDLLTGSGNPQGPQRRGGFFGGSGLEGFSGVGGGGFGRVGGTTGGGGNAPGGNTGAGAQRAGGFYGLLQTAREIQNQESNVAALRSSLAQFEAAQEAGRINRFQVDQNRQQLYLAQSALLISKTNYQQQLDVYKFELGLPPAVPIEADDPYLDEFMLIDPRLSRIQNDAVDLLDSIRDAADLPTRDDLFDVLQDAETVRTAVGAQIGVVDEDFKKLTEALPRRRAWLRRLGEREDVRAGAVEASAYDQDTLTESVQIIIADFEKIENRFDGITAVLTALDEEADALETADLRNRLIGILTDLSTQLAELLLVQARVRLNAAVLVPIEITSEQAYDIARELRLDWMNARAALVDSWRLIEFNANALESDLNLVFSGDIQNTTDNPVRFRGSTGRLRVGVEFDAPLTRVFERNTFRQSIIEYQQARRQYMLIVDQISFGLRNRVRQISLNQLNFEVRRAAVDIAISQVEQTRQRLEEPPRPGETSTLGPTTARDLVDALTTLLNAQNDFLSIWVNYEVQRIGLDFDLGTLQLDETGMWVDPGPIRETDVTCKLGATPDDLPEGVIPPISEPDMSEAIDGPEGSGPPEILPVPDAQDGV